MQIIHANPYFLMYCFVSPISVSITCRILSPRSLLSWVENTVIMFLLTSSWTKKIRYSKWLNSFPLYQFFFQSRFYFHALQSMFLFSFVVCHLVECYCEGTPFLLLQDNFSLWDPSSIPGSGRSPGEGNGNPLQYSCLENSAHREAWQAISPWVARVGHDLATKSLPPPQLSELEWFKEQS